MQDESSSSVSDDNPLGVIVVDHGSRRAASNDLLLEVVRLFQQHSGYAIVEPAHMELAEPSVRTAVDRCVERGARRIVVQPYFLLPGRHWDKDIPEIVCQAACSHPDVDYRIGNPLGLHPLMAEIMRQRVRESIDTL